MSVDSLIVWIVVLGLLFDYTNGFHDAANVVSTVIATRVLRPLVAILLAGTLNMIGATQISGVARTIAEGLVDPALSTQWMVLSALVGAILWNLITWYFGVPSSSSYALIGGLLGPALFWGGAKAIFWSSLTYKVVIPMILSPFIGFAMGYCAMRGVSALLRIQWIHRRRKLFDVLQIFSASVVAFAHGINDAQKSMGIITLGLFAGAYIDSPAIPLWVILACAVVMGLGTASGGFRIIRTIGYGITKLEPSQGFAAETGSSCVILVASFFGMPISSTQVIVGSVTGVGSGKERGKVRWDVLRKLTLAWMCTLPCSAGLSSLVYWVVR